MRISTKGRYAVRIMLDIANNSDSGAVAIKNIASRQGISDKYMEHIISNLKTAGMVQSSRGPQGGYRLVKKPCEYTVGAILRTTEGSISPVACLEDGAEPCPRAEKCVAVKLWGMVDDAIKGVVDRITLQDLMEWENEMGLELTGADCSE